MKTHDVEIIPLHLRAIITARYSNLVQQPLKTQFRGTDQECIVGIHKDAQCTFIESLACLCAQKLALREGRATMGKPAKNKNSVSFHLKWRCHPSQRSPGQRRCAPGWTSKTFPGIPKRRRPIMRACTLMASNAFCQSRATMAAHPLRCASAESK